jgi:trehalose 6-phosphate phosphatase
MTSLFSKAALAELRQHCHSRILFAFDYDGTLAKIVKNPDAAHMAAETEFLIKELSALAPIAVVSGRAVSDLNQRLGFTPEFLIGNHGLETNTRKAGRLAESQCQKWVRQLEKNGLPEGVWIENKKYSLSIHYREAKSSAKAQILKAAAQLTPAPRLVGGKAVLNVIPKSAPDKGKALLQVMQEGGFTHAVYVGDDETDEDVFRVAKQGVKIFKIRVGRKRNSLAKYYIEQQKEINRVLTTLLAQKKAGIL